MDLHQHLRLWHVPPCSPDTGIDYQGRRRLGFPRYRFRQDRLDPVEEHPLIPEDIPDCTRLHEFVLRALVPSFDLRMSDEPTLLEYVYLTLEERQVVGYRVGTAAEVRTVHDVLRYLPLPWTYRVCIETYESVLLVDVPVCARVDLFEDRHQLESLSFPGNDLRVSLLEIHLEQDVSRIGLEHLADVWALRLDKRIPNGLKGRH